MLKQHISETLQMAQMIMANPQAAAQERVQSAMKLWGGVEQAPVTILNTTTGADLPIPTDDDTSNTGAIVADIASGRDLATGTIKVVEVATGYVDRILVLVRNTGRGKLSGLELDLLLDQLLDVVGVHRHLAPSPPVGQAKEHAPQAIHGEPPLEKLGQPLSESPAPRKVHSTCIHSWSRICSNAVTGLRLKWRDSLLPK
mgnify:CR=1 FL=1